MGLHDIYMKDIQGTSERKQHVTGEIEINKELYEEVKRKVKINFRRLDEDGIEELKAALPKNYRPSQERIEEQKKYSEDIHEEIFATHFDLALSSKFSKIWSTFSNDNVDRGLQIFYGYLSYYASDVNRNRLETLSENIFDKLCAVDKAEKENADADKLDALREELYDAREALAKFEDEIVVEELRRTAEAAPRLLELINETTTPEKIFENYREIRLRLSFMAESDNFLSENKHRFDEAEYEKLRLAIGSVQAKGMEVLYQASYIANPILAENFDLEEMKVMGSNGLDLLSVDVTDWDIFDPEKAVGATEEEKQLDKRCMQLEAESVSDFTETSVFTYNEWMSEIKTYFDCTGDLVKIKTFDGEVFDLKPENFMKLYEEGTPFFAFHKNSNRGEAVVCLPTEGHHLAVGKEQIDKIDTGKLEFNLPRPSKLAYALDHIKSFFGKEYRVESVKRYEDELALYNKRVILRDYAKHAKNYVRSIETKQEAIEFALDVIKEENANSLEAEDAKIVKEAKDAGKSVEEYVRGYKQREQDAIAKLEKKNKILKDLASSKAEKNKLIAKLKETNLPKQNIRRIRLAYDEAEKKVSNELSVDKRNWLKCAAALIVRNRIKAELESTLVGKDFNNLSPLLSKITKIEKVPKEIEKSINSFAENKAFEIYVNKLPKEKKAELFEGPNTPENAVKIDKFLSDFQEFVAAEEGKKDVAKKYDLNTGKHRQEKAPDIKPIG